MVSYALRVLAAALVIVVVSEVARFKPRAGALMLSFPISSLIAFVLIWVKDKDAQMVSSLARETLVMIPLTLIFFIPFAWMERLQIEFWTALAIATGVTVSVLGLWFLLAPGRL